MNYFSGKHFSWLRKKEQQRCENEFSNLAAGSDDDITMHGTGIGKDNFSDIDLSDELLVEEEDVSLAPTCFSFEEDDTEENTPDTARKIEYSYGDHADYLFVHQDTVTKHFYCDVSHFFVESRFFNLVTEFTSTMSLEDLNDLFVGYDSSIDEPSEPLPLRVLTIRLRPDITASEIIDTVYESCRGQPNSTVTIVKQDKNRCQCLVSSTEGNMTVVSSFMLDAQICTRRQSPFERELVIRILPGEKIEDTIRCSPSVDDLMSPINRHMKEVAAFIRNIMGIEMKNPGIIIEDLPYPEKSPGMLSDKSVEWMDDSSDSLSFPLLQRCNQTVMEQSLHTILRIWKLLSSNQCSFHTIEAPDIDPGDSSKPATAPTFDPSYCSQLSLLSQKETVLEVDMTTMELEKRSEQHHEQHVIFKKFINAAREKYGTWETTELDLLIPPRPSMPPFKLPAGYTFLAMRALKEMQYSTANVFSMVDEAVMNVYQACCNEGRAAADVYQKKAEHFVLKELIDIQTTQVALLLDIEYDPEAQQAAMEFGRRARKAINLKGRVQRRLKGRVPILSFRYWSGECIVTSTAMLCITKHAFQANVDLYDLKAISLEKTWPNTVLVSSLQDGERLHTIQSPRVKVDELLQFVMSLQELQGYFLSSARSTNHHIHRL
jgi:hypothetical protein